MKRLSTVLIATVLALGCQDAKSTFNAITVRTAATTGTLEAGHDHGDGPHGGCIMDLGKYHAEFTVDHPTKKVTVYILSAKLNKSVAIATDQLVLSIKMPAFKVDLIANSQDGDPKGKSSRFVAVHDNFGVEQEFEGTIAGTVDGDPLEGEFKEKPEGSKKKR